MYANLSYLNGVIRFDLSTGTITHTVELPLSAFAQATYKTMDEYPHDSAHHGLALSGDGTRLCDVGTIDNQIIHFHRNDEPRAHRRRRDGALLGNDEP
jgi:hypothetical protein